MILFHNCSIFKISSFSPILILSPIRDLSESKGFTDIQNSMLSVTFFIFKFSWYPLLDFHTKKKKKKKIHSNSFSYYKKFYLIER